MLPPDTPSPAEAIFFEGPETVVAAAQLIVAGPPRELAKRVDKQSAGSAPFPMEWTISGVILHPTLLKGSAAPPRVSFHRHEQSMFAMPDASIPDWELDLGSAEQAAAEVLLYRTPYPSEPLKVLPSQHGGTDVPALVADIVRIQALPSASARAQAWSEYALKASAGEGRRAALRSLFASGEPWPAVVPAWRPVLAHGPDDVRAFAYKLMLFAVSKGRWLENRDDILALARQTFLGEQNIGLALDYAGGLALLHGAAMRDPVRLHGMRQAVCDILRERPTLGPDTDDHARSLNEAYRQQRDSCLAGG